MTPTNLRSRPLSIGQIQGGTGGSTVPAECVLVLDRRLLPGESPDAVLTSLCEHVAALRLEDRGLSAEVSMPMAMPAFETRPTAGSRERPRPRWPTRVDRVIRLVAGPRPVTADSWLATSVCP